MKKKKERKERQVRGKERRSKESEQKERERKQKRGRRRYGKYGNTLVPAGKGWLYQGISGGASIRTVQYPTVRRRKRVIDVWSCYFSANAQYKHIKIKYGKHFFSSILFYIFYSIVFQGIRYHGSQRPLPSHGIRTVLYSSSQSNIGPHKWAATA